MPCYDRPMTMYEEEQLNRLKRMAEKEERELKTKLAQKKAKIKAVEGRIRARISARERKRRTRRLIVLGGLMEKEAPPAALLSKLDRSLDRDQDRALFGLPPKAPAGAVRSSPAGAAPLKG